jgi:uncharacterized tellurite resistance protein B-like protein
MLSTIRSFVQSAIAPDCDEKDENVGMQMAAAALLLEVAAADFESQPEERAVVCQAVQQAFGLGHKSVQQLLSDAEQHHQESISIYEYTRVLNEQCSHQQKFEILTHMWRVAFVDGRLDKYEDNRIRRIADLLYIPHREFIQAKHIADQ